MAKQKPDLAAALRQPTIRGRSQAPEAPRANQQKDRIGKESITLFYPSEVKRQLLSMKLESRRTLHQIVGEALNDLFAKYGRPEIVPTEEGA